MTVIEYSLPLTLGDYRLEDVIGRGGMGVVYRARQPALDRYAAVKVLSPEHAADALHRERFLRETCNAARVEHPHVVPVYQAGEARGLLYLAMRLIDGPDLKTLLAMEGPFDPPRAVRLVCQLADALAAAHAQGLVHRDVKPRNVLVAGPYAYLVDFGLARQLHGDESLTTDGRCAGTLDYIAPEVLRGGAATPASDVYSLGCLLYELLTGRVPFPAKCDAEKITGHLIRRPPRIGLADQAALRLDAVVQRAMAKSPEKRYAGTGHLAHAARRAVDDSSESPLFIEAQPPKPATNIGPARNRVRPYRGPDRTRPSARR